METATARVRHKGQITLPAAVREAARIHEGAIVEVSVTGDGAVVLRPKVLVDAQDAWYWTEQWQAGEREVDEEIARNGPGPYLSEEKFLASLDD
jgi:AbrB family looped-hinge helix DNA binding protein